MAARSFLSVRAIKEFPDAQFALDTLAVVAAISEPLCAQHGWVVGILEEIAKVAKPTIELGINFNRGQKIQLQLRSVANTRAFRDLTSVIDTMMHELAHNKHSDHGEGFNALWDALNHECEANLMVGIAGDAAKYGGSTAAAAVLANFLRDWRQLGDLLGGRAPPGAAMPRHLAMRLVHAARPGGSSNDDSVWATAGVAREALTGGGTLAFLSHSGYGLPHLEAGGGASTAASRGRSGGSKADGAAWRGKGRGRKAGKAPRGGKACSASAGAAAAAVVVAGNEGIGSAVNASSARAALAAAAAAARRDTGGGGGSSAPGSRGAASSNAAAGSLRALFGAAGTGSGGSSGSGGSTCGSGGGGGGVHIRPAPAGMRVVTAAPGQFSCLVGSTAGAGAPASVGAAASAAPSAGIGVNNDGAAANSSSASGHSNHHGHGGSASSLAAAPPAPAPVCVAPGVVSVEALRALREMQRRAEQPRPPPPAARPVERPSAAASAISAGAGSAGGAAKSPAVTDDSEEVVFVDEDDDALGAATVAGAFVAGSMLSLEDSIVASVLAQSAREAAASRGPPGLVQSARGCASSAPAAAGGGGGGDGGSGGSADDGNDGELKAAIAASLHSAVAPGSLGGGGASLGAALGSDVDSEVVVVEGDSDVEGTDGNAAGACAAKSPTGDLLEDGLDAEAFNDDAEFVVEAEGAEASDCGDDEDAADEAGAIVDCGDIGEGGTGAACGGPARGRADSVGGVRAEEGEGDCSSADVIFLDLDGDGAEVGEDAAIMLAAALQQSQLQSQLQLAAEASERLSQGCCAGGGGAGEACDEGAACPQCRPAVASAVGSKRPRRELASTVAAVLDAGADADVD